LWLPLIGQAQGAAPIPRNPRDPTSGARMIANVFKMKATVWQYPGAGGWHFLTLPQEESEIIKEAFGALKQGWGSLPVTVTIGQTVWKTSIFPDSKTGSYLLPLKAEVRKKEKIGIGDTITFSIEIRG
jgi:hypothetical protein